MKEVSRIIISDGERVLLGKRTSKIAYGMWSIFGGKADEGETPEETALREVYEETGIAVDAVEFLFTDQDQLAHYFEAQVANLILLNISEHSDAQWFTWQEIESMQEEIAFNHFLILKEYFGIR